MFAYVEARLNYNQACGYQFGYKVTVSVITICLVGLASLGFFGHETAIFKLSGVATALVVLCLVICCGIGGYVIGWCLADSAKNNHQ